MPETLIIPSARLVPVELRSEFGEIPSGLVPVGSRPALSYILERWSGAALPAQTVVAVGEGGDLIRSVTGALDRADLQCLDVGTRGSLGWTVLAAIEAAGRPAGSLVVNFADTWVGDELPTGDVICARPAGRDASRWTVFAPRPDGGIALIGPGAHTGADDRIFVGVVQLADGPLFCGHLRAACLEAADVPGDGHDPFFIALVRYLSARPGGARVLDVDDWRDFGHLDTYYATRRAFLATRFFNSVEVRADKGTLVKRARPGRKLLQEAGWYQGLPEGLCHLAPRVIGVAGDDAVAEVELEFYGYPTLNDMYLFGAFDDALWAQVLDGLEAALRALWAHPLDVPGDDPALRSAREEMFERKTRARLAEIPEDGPLAAFLGESVVINGRRIPGVGHVRRELHALCHAVDLYRPSPFTVLHGDFCLSNILFDRRNGFVRCIDPRGDFGGFRMHGDPLYDVAKLAHSLQGDYDFLVNDLATGGWSKSGFCFRTRGDARHARVRRLFDEWLAATFDPADRKRIALIQALLFLSMVPLHRDNPTAQARFLARGLELYAGCADAAWPDARLGDVA